VSGENGIGKSTIFSALSKVVYRGALMNYFKNIGDSSSEITYKYQGKVNTWTKNPNWKRTDNNEEIRFFGTFEASILFGNRYADIHKSKIKNSYKVKKYDLKSADPFVKDNLSNILRDSDSYYNDLKIISTKTQARNLGFEKQIYFLERNNKLISQFFMSSGELLVLGLLNFINEAVKKRSGHTTLIMIDEIDTALHPSAQLRLIKTLHYVAETYDFCIYFSTHSIPILNFLSSEKIFHIQKSFSGKLEVVNPCYSAYASRNLHGENIGYDFLVLTEDDLIKFIVEKILKKNKLHDSKMIKILPCAGWENTLKFHKDAERSNLAGVNCKIISILDADIQEEYKAKYDKNMKSYLKTFLPLKSIEKYLKNKIVDDPDDEFCKQFGDNFYRERSLHDIIKDYQSRTEKDNNGKILFMVLKKCGIEQGYTDQAWKREVCEFIYNFDDFKKIEDTVVHFLKD